MATTNKKAAEATPQGSTAKKKYAVGKLKANCRRLFGVSSSTFAGATCGMAGNYTVEEMRAHIDAWKKKGVK